MKAFVVVLVCLGCALGINLWVATEREYLARDTHAESISAAGENAATEQSALSGELARVSDVSRPKVASQKFESEGAHGEIASTGLESGGSLYLDPMDIGALPLIEVPEGMEDVGEYLEPISDDYSQHPVIEANIPAENLAPSAFQDPLAPVTSTSGFNVELNPSQNSIYIDPDSKFHYPRESNLSEGFPPNKNSSQPTPESVSYPENELI